MLEGAARSRLQVMAAARGDTSQPLTGRQGNAHGAGYGDSRSVGSIYKL